MTEQETASAEKQEAADDVAAETVSPDEVQETQSFEPVTVEAQDGNVVVGVDLNRDGQKSVALKVSLSEALGEILKRDDAAKTDATKFSYRFEGATVVLVLDTDADGQSLAELRVDLLQLIAEGQKLVSK